MSSDPDIDGGSDPGLAGNPDERVVTMRLQKFLARAGAASRRGSEDLMTAERVTVNGVVVTELGAKVDPSVDVVELDGRAITLADSAVYLALHKPTGVVTTMSDPHGRPTVATLVPAAENPGLFPVGRLDADTTGLLLFTTDGELSHRLLHPRWKVPKTYRVLVDGAPDGGDMRKLANGVTLDDGITAPADVKTIEHRESTTMMEITIREGRKRQVRRMFSAVRHPVLELERVSFGPVLLGGLELGAWRELSTEEVRALRRAAGIEGV